MSSKEDPSKCCPAAAPISSFTIQSILGSGSADPPREAGDRAPSWPSRARTLSLSSEDEEPEESWKHRGCFCPEAQGPAEACHKHQPLSFTCLGEYPEGWDGPRREGPQRARPRSGPRREEGGGGTSHLLRFRGTEYWRRPWVKRVGWNSRKNGVAFEKSFSPHLALISPRDAVRWITLVFLDPDYSARAGGRMMFIFF